MGKTTHDESAVDAARANTARGRFTGKNSNVWGVKPRKRMPLFKG